MHLTLLLTLICCMISLYVFFSAGQCRYVWKYSGGGENEITLKVTDDVKVIQFRADQQNQMRLIEQWNYIMAKLCTSKQPNAAAIMAEIGTQTSTRSGASCIDIYMYD